MNELFGVYDQTGEASVHAAAAFARLASFAGETPREAPILGAPWRVSSILSILDAKMNSEGAVGRSRSIVIDPEAAKKTSPARGRRVSVSICGEWRPRESVGQSDQAADAHAFLQAYETGGELAVCDAGGSWIAAIHDHETQTVTVMRSREASPSLSYFEQDGVVWFGSDLPRLLRLPQIATSVAFDAVSYFLAFGFPPPDRSLFSGVRRLEPGASLRMSPASVSQGPAQTMSPAPVDELVSDPVAAFAAVIAASIAPEIAGRRVAVLGAPADPRTQWLAEACRRAGAAAVVQAPEQPDVFGSLGAALAGARQLIAAEGEPFVTPSMLALAAQAEAARKDADICITAEGSHVSLPFARRHSVFAKRLANLGAAAARKSSSRKSSFHAGAAFNRDLYFEQIAVFDDVARLALAGPMLAQWNVFSMADELGPSLEEATPETASELSWAVDDRLVSAGESRRAVDVAQRASGIPIVAPFLSASVRGHLRVIDRGDLPTLGRALKGWPDELMPMYAVEKLIDDGEEAVRALLGPERLLDRGVFGRVALNDLLERHFNGVAPDARRVWTLCCLELWFQEFMDG